MARSSREQEFRAAGEAKFARLKKRADFLRAAKGFRWHGSSFSLQVFRPEQDGAACAAPRWGLTVTKKVGGAVERNRIKRRLRGALNAPGLAAEPGRDYVIVARRGALSAPFQDLVAELANSMAATRHRGGSGRRESSPARRSGAKRPPQP